MIELKAAFIKLQSFTLLALIILFTSCNGQVQTSPQMHTNRDDVNDSAGHVKLVKTQGTDQYISVRCAVQDKAGNLWFGTSGEGVYRYDGKIFTQFTVDDGLSSNKVWSILEDKSGNIWFGTTDGICRYDGKSIVAVSIDEKIRPNLSSNQFYTEWSTKNTVWAMLQDKSGTIWFGTGDGVYCYQEDSFTRFLFNDNVLNEEGLHLKMVDDILEDKNGNIWFASGMLPGQEGLCRFDGKKLTRFKPGGDVWIRYVLEDRQGTIWSSGRHQGNWCYDGKTFSKYTQKEGIGAPLLLDKAGNIWFSGEENTNGYEGKGGVWRYDGKSFKNFTIQDGMGNYGVWMIFEDKAGNIWFGTRNNGLYKYDGKIFTNYSE